MIVLRKFQNNLLYHYKTFGERNTVFVNSFDTGRREIRYFGQK